MLAEQFVQAQIKENIKALRHWSFWGESTGHRWIHKTPVTQKMFPFDGAHHSHDWPSATEVNLEYVGESLEALWGLYTEGCLRVNYNLILLLYNENSHIALSITNIILQGEKD